MQIWEAALAVRMGMMRALAGRSIQTPLVGVEENAGEVDATVPADGGMAALADAVEKLVATRDGLPELVEVGGVATFRVTADTLGDGRLAGCVAVVTGSAQGFGRGIAEELLREGARVVVADINDALGEETVEAFAETYGDGRVMYRHMNVAELASVREALEATVERFGGLDLFVANAGVLKAGGLDEMDEKSFALVTKVNYEAYFLGAKAASAIMRRQHELHPEHFMDIVQINSKSGLEGSKRNFAYAGSKFGTIGLTQSFALELVGYNIKVNSICPGNYFDGPLWSDPERGLFVQYLNTGKVPGAQTIEDVKRFYMAKIPMNRGCTPEDVTQAILYCHDQKYETGQAIPVTGGQVMLN